MRWEDLPQNNFVTAVLYSQNKPERIIKIVEDIQKYVNEIIIIYMGSSENFTILMKHKKTEVKTYHLPRLEIVEPLLKLGANLANNNWIFYLKDNEIPCVELMENLKPNEEFVAFNVLLQDNHYNTKEYGWRFFNKKEVYFSGFIQMGIIPMGKCAHLNKPIYRKDNKLNHSDALLDAYMYGPKFYLLLATTGVRELPSPPPYNDKRIQVVFSKLFERSLINHKKISWLLASFTKSLFDSIHDLYKERSLKSKKTKISRHIYVFFNIFNGFETKVNIWKSIIEKGSITSYLNLNTLKDFKRLENRDQSNLLLSLIEGKIR